MRAAVVMACVGLMVDAVSVSAQSVPLPAAVCQELRTGRAALPTPMTAAQRGALLNRAAWVGRVGGMGLSRKTSGNLCPSLVGSIACDVLRLDKPGTYWDVITGNTAESINCSNSAGTITDPARFWVAPVEPAGGGGGGGGTPVPPVPPDPDLAARVAVLESTVKSQQSALSALDARVTVMGNRVTALEVKPPPPVPLCVPHEVTTSRDGGGWYGPGHSHRVIVCQ